MPNTLEAKWSQISKTANNDAYGLVMTALGLNTNQYLELEDKIREKDEMTADLLTEVLSKITDLIKVPPQAMEALDRIDQVRQHPNEPALVRNNVFKAAHALGMKLPSSSF
jgi:hypothetical protein